MDTYTSYLAIVFFIYNLKIYNLLTYIYINKNDTIGSMIGMATLNGLLTYNNTDANGYNWILVGPLFREPVCVEKVISTV